MESAEWLDPVRGQLSHELRFAKSVLLGMLEKSAIDPSIQSGAGYFLKEEEPRGFEDTLNFGNSDLPVHNVTQGSEVENSIEGFIRKRKFLDTPHRKNSATLGVLAGRGASLAAASIQWQ